MAEENSNKGVRSLAEVKNELNQIVGDKDTLNQLVSTTFKGLNVEVAKQAMLEAMFRGFKFDDFLKKNVYAVPFKGSYSLVTSIDHARKIGMRSGVVGVDAPVFQMGDDGKIISCSQTVKKKNQDGYIGDYTAVVFFKEYSTGTNLWATKPHTMISKVAEMHALRKACPEELSQAYDESEIHREVVTTTTTQTFDDVDETIVSDWSDQLEQAADLETLQRVWVEVPVVVKPKLKTKLAECSKRFEDIQTENKNDDDSVTQPVS